MKTHQVLLVVVLAVAIVPAMVSGADIVSYGVGTGYVEGLPEGSPGTAVSLDFTAHPQINPPAQLVQINLTFQSAGVAFDRLKIQLDAGPDIYSFDPISGQYVTYFFYDPAWMPGTGTTPHSELDQLWKDELADGVLDCHLWVEGITPGMSGFHFSSGGSFLVPEPATLGLLGIGGLMLLKRRRRG